ncbi:MAG TPA: AI-2E family transporter [Candidatus Limnocylindrales bacterium]|jgi:predicted PurR-regulated permease PerM
MEIQLPESERRWLHAALVLGTLVLALVLVAQVAVILSFFSDILLVLLLAWLLAFMLSPLVGMLDRAVPQLPRVLVVGGVYLGMFIILSWIALVVAGNLASSISGFITQLPTFQARLPEILAPIQSIVSSLGFQVDVAATAKDILANLGSLGGNLVEPLTGVALFSLGIVGNLLIVIFLSLFILLDKDRILAYANRLVPPQYSEQANLFETSVASSFGGFIRGQFIQGLIYAGVAAFAHILFGLDFLPASAALSGVLQAIPFFGPFVSWAPPVIVAVLTKPEAALPTLIVMGIGWFIVMNIVQPRVMSQAIGLHPVIVLVSVLIGVKIAGIAGAVFALPFAAVIAAFFQHFLSRNVRVPRDVTTMAAKRVGEREGRPVRVPKPPPVNAGGSAAANEPVPDEVPSVSHKSDTPAEANADSSA